MKINEIFYSIQGEGSWTGLPNIFIRTTGCNLRCSYCDTKYAYKEGKEVAIDKIMRQISRYPCKHVCITGGEPLMQSEILDLIKNLSKDNYQISIETNGSLDARELTKFKSLLISLDIKCPSSKMNEKNNFNNISLLRKQDQIKFIISDKKDYEYAKKTLDKYKPACTVYFQPVWGSNPKNLANWIIDDSLEVKLGIQLHKIIWGNRRGV